MCLSVWQSFFSKLLGSKGKTVRKSQAGAKKATPLCLPNNCKWDSSSGQCIRTGEKRTSLYVVDEALENLRRIKGKLETCSSNFKTYSQVNPALNDSQRGYITSLTKFFLYNVENCAIYLTFSLNVSTKSSPKVVPKWISYNMKRNT